MNILVYIYVSYDMINTFFAHLGRISCSTESGYQPVLAMFLDVQVHIIFSKPGQAYYPGLGHLLRIWHIVRKISNQYMRKTQWRPVRTKNGDA
jgi:hypothetical protein